MHWLYTQLNGQTAQLLVETLIHTLWQGCLLAGLLKLALLVIPTDKPQKRYTFSLTALALLVVAGFLTFSILKYVSTDSIGQMVSSQQLSAPETDTQMPIPNPQEAQTTEPSTAARFSPPARHEQGFGLWSYALGFWLIGVSFMFMRLGYMLSGQTRITGYCIEVTEPAVITIFHQLRTFWQIPDGVRLFVCSRITQPAVMGIIRPAILLPASVLSGISPEMLRAILAHELAHIRRHDYLINLCQMIIEAVLFFNPAVWWFNRHIRLERELCCDTAGAVALGSEHNYAHLLLDWLVSTHKQSASPAALAFSQDKNQTLERARRLLMPGRGMQSHTGWLRWACSLLITLVVGWGLLMVSDAAVFTAGKILSPQERVEIMADLEESHGTIVYDHNVVNGPMARDVFISGSVRTWDAKPLDKRVNMHLSVQNGVTSSSYTVRLLSQYRDMPVTDPNYNRFEFKPQAGNIVITTNMEGYAPASYGPFTLKAGQSRTDIEIVLEEGFPVEILVQDESSLPVAGAAITGGYPSPTGYQYIINLTTNSEGIAVLEHACDRKVSLRITAAGLEDTSFENLNLNKTSPLVLTMTRSLPTTGIVRSGIDSTPIAGAKILLMAHDMSIIESDASNSLLTTTDNQGRFSLDRLQKNSNYVICAIADGFGNTIVKNIASGMKDVEIKLGKPLIIRGEIIGPLDKLLQKDGKPAISYKECLRLPNNEHYQNKYSAITSEGGKNYFEIVNPWGNELAIGHEVINLEKTIANPVVIDVTEKQIEGHKRQVTLNFVTAANMPMITGTIVVVYRDNKNSKGLDNRKVLEIKDGKVSLDIQVPNRIMYDMGNTVGYWLLSKTVEIADGTEPLVIDVPTVPAGMIYGEIFASDGQQTQAMVSLKEIKLPPLPENRSYLDIKDKNTTDSLGVGAKYAMNPLPLGGTYGLVAHTGNTYVVSEPITLSETEPIVCCNLTFPPTVMLTGKIVLPDGSPARQIPYSFLFVSKYGRYGSGSVADGTFEIPGINPQADGKYILSVDPKRDYQKLDVKIKDFTKQLEITLKPGAVLNCQIIDDETGLPVPDVQVNGWFNSTEFYHYTKAEAASDKEGKVRFSNLCPGKKYTIEPEIYGRPIVQVKAIAGQGETVEIHLPRRTK